MIVDGHVHYAEPEGAGGPPGAAAARHYDAASVESVIADAGSIGIDKIVQTTPLGMGWDNRYGLEGAAKYPDRVFGVFGRFDPFTPDPEGPLRAFMAQPGMLGVRIQPTSGQWLQEQSLDPFLRVAERLDVPVRFYAKNQPREMYEIARRFPGLRLIIEHLTLVPSYLSKDTGGPFARWSDILTLAAEPNVWSQISMLTEVAPEGETFPFPTSQRRLQELYEHAGAARLVWGSHYPAVVNRCSYREALDFVRVGCSFLGARDRDLILGENLVASFTPAAIGKR
jgi:predicted TIM-barrel fold metal-dependent hydrolase